MRRRAASVATLRGRRWAALGASLLTIGVVQALGHRGGHAAASLLVPGAGLWGDRPWLGAGLTVAAVIAAVAWTRWGTDWLVLAVTVTSVVVTARVQPTGSAQASDALRNAHEFPLVLLVVGALGWLGATLGRLPLPRLHTRLPPATGGLDHVALLAPVDRCRAVAIAALVGPQHVNPTALLDGDVHRRARRIGLVARGRTGDDPFLRDHAHARAALALTGVLHGDGLERFRGDGDRSWTGVPSSEPGWVRLLDGTLAATALEAPRWATTLDGPFALRRGHRAGAVWTPLGIAAGRAPDWEHAAATALARRAGWIDGDADWTALRRRALGAAARGARHAADERLVAAGRLWLTAVHDPEAASILARPTIGRDPLAAALDLLASTRETTPAR